MDEGTQGLLILISISIVCSLIIHSVYRNYWVSAHIAAIISTILFQIADFVHRGYLDKFALIALIVGGFYAWLISLLVGFPFKFVRKSKSSDGKS